MRKRIVVFIHGWSVTHTNTYGAFPDRLAAEAKDAELDIDIKNIWLGKYVSFHDEVQLADISEALDAAIHRELGREIEAGQRLAFITHSTGGPVVRHWWHRYYRLDSESHVCPMSHLIMLAPANFGSALAQLGKSRISRVMAWANGIEPGQGVLDWLELGSPDAWNLNRDWIHSKAPWEASVPVFPFVLTGQSIDRGLYDHVVPLTGEMGSDGVVRAASANLRATYVRLEQRRSPKDSGSGDLRMAPDPVEAPRAAFSLIPGRSHSGARMGIIRSVKNDGSPDPTVDAVLRCLKVADQRGYESLRDAFDSENAALGRRELVEVERGFLVTRTFIHDPHSMVIFRVMDREGRIPPDFDILLVGGRGRREGLDLLPAGFFVHRQKNGAHPGTITYYMNHAMLVGCQPVTHRKATIRRRQVGLDRLGIKINPLPQEGFAHYSSASASAGKGLLKTLLHPNQTTLVDIVLDRVVHEGVFFLDKSRVPASFKDQAPGEALRCRKPE